MTTKGDKNRYHQTVFWAIILLFVAGELAWIRGLASALHWFIRVHPIRAAAAFLASILAVIIAALYDVYGRKVHG